MKLFNKFRNKKTHTTASGHDEAKNGEKDKLLSQPKKKKGFLSKVFSLNKEGDTDDEAKKKKKGGFLRGLFSKKVSNKNPLKTMKARLFNQNSASAKRAAEEAAQRAAAEAAEKERAAAAEARAAALQSWAAQQCAAGAAAAARPFAALRLQCWWRQREAHWHAARLRAEADRDALRFAEEWRRREAERRARERARRAAAAAAARAVVAEAYGHLKYPRAATQIQRCWRGVLGRARYAAMLEAYRAWQRRQLELQRYRAALRKVRREESERFHGEWDCTLQRSFAASEWHADGGWQPTCEAGQGFGLRDHVWRPPAGEAHGVRTHKVPLPARDHRERRLVLTDRNTWVGIPVGVAPARPPPARRLGPWPARESTWAAAARRPAGEGGGRRGKRGRPGGGGGGGLAHSGSASELRLDQESGASYFVTRYTWVPAPLVTGAAALQEEQECPSSGDGQSTNNQGEWTSHSGEPTEYSLTEQDDQTDEKQIKTALGQKQQLKHPPGGSKKNKKPTIALGGQEGGVLSSQQLQHESRRRGQEVTSPSRFNKKKGVTTSSGPSLVPAKTTHTDDHLQNKTWSMVSSQWRM